MKEVIRVMLVDDHPLWRRTMRQVLGETAGVAVVAEACDGGEAVPLAAEAKPNVILMDIDMPSVDGVEATSRLAEVQPDAKVLVLSASDARSHVIGALAAGAAGYLLKTAGAREIREGIAKVARGETVVPPALTRHLVDALRGGRSDAGERSGIDALSERELEILNLMAGGYSNAAICEAIHLSAKTVEGYIATMFTKLGLEPARDQHRRVLAVLRYLEARNETAPQ